MNPQHPLAPDDTPVQPVSGGHKESEPIQSEPSEDQTEYQVPKEVVSHVQLQEQKPEIPPDLQNIGVTHASADQTIKHSATTLQPTPVPLTDEEIAEGMTKAPSDSFRWLARWCIKQLESAHVHFKKVKGRYIRVSS